MTSSIKNAKRKLDKFYRKAKKLYWPGEFGASILSEEEILRIKREGQKRSRELVRSGERTQESMFLIPREIAKASKVRHRGI